jgi:hypothetical protein
VSIQIVAVLAGGEREFESFGLPRQRLGVQADVGVGGAGRLVQPGVAWILALGLKPGVVGFLGAACAEQQIGDQCLRAWVVVKLAVPASGDGLTHRVDRVFEATELLVGIGELVQIAGAVWLGLGKPDHARD